MYFLLFIINYNIGLYEKNVKMKYILILYVCSFIEGNGCLPPVESKQTFNSWYECSMTAHKEAVRMLQKMGYAEVNKYKVGLKYTCKPVMAH